jgi:hypothetical protein
MGGPEALRHPVLRREGRMSGVLAVVAMLLFPGGLFVVVGSLA